MSDLSRLRKPLPTRTNELRDWYYKMRNAKTLIIIGLLTLSLTACTKPVLVKPDCVRPVVKVSEVTDDRSILIILNELVTIIQEQESTIKCYEAWSK